MKLLVYHYFPTPGNHTFSTTRAQIHGKGVLAYANGNRYDGSWENDVISGRGTLIYADGDRYDGDWVNGKMHGSGEGMVAASSLFTLIFREQVSTHMLMATSTMVNGLMINAMVRMLSSCSQLLTG